MERGLVLRYTAPGWAEAAFSQLYPGGYACVFGQTRDALAAEDAGFEVRDCLTVLGPTIHRVWLLRRPCQEATVAAQVLKTGTGGLWIDGCRVVSDMSEFVSATGKPRSGMGHAHGYGMGEGYGGDKANPPHAGGRWPANLLLMHTPECEAVGTKRVGPDGLEPVQAWECGPGCVIPKLNAQSGVLTSGEVKSHYMRNNSKNPADGGYSGKLGDVPLMGYGDTGGASRFFPQFVDEVELDAWLLKLITGPSQTP